MLETGIGLALLPPRPYLFDDLTETTDLLEDDRALTIINDTTINSERREAFIQQTKIGWTSLFMGYMTVEWRRSTAKLDHKWTIPCLRLFLEWGRACWAHRNTTLYGPSKNRKQQRQKRL